MLIQYLGTGGSPRSFIQPLQRCVAAGEIIDAKETLASALLATQRWRRVPTKTHTGRAASTPPPPLRRGPKSRTSPTENLTTEPTPPNPNQTEETP
jgi:hypothetical protein